MFGARNSLPTATDPGLKPLIDNIHLVCKWPSIYVFYYHLISLKLSLLEIVMLGIRFSQPTSTGTQRDDID